MSSSITKVVIIMVIFILFGCKKNMDYEPEDFFEGRQLAIAKAIYEGGEDDLLKKLSLIREEELNKPAKAGMTLLFWAMINTTGHNITSGRLLIITDLVKAGADPLQPRPAGGSSPAEFAMKADKGIWIKALLDGGLSPDARDKIHNKPIIFGSMLAKNTETLRVMLEYGANPNTQDALGDSLLMDSLDAQSYAQTLLLLDKGADSSIRGKSGWSMANQLERLLTQSDQNSKAHLKLEEIKTAIIKNGGQWPPLPFEE